MIRRSALLAASGVTRSRPQTRLFNLLKRTLVLDGKLETSSAEYRENTAVMSGHIEALNRALEGVRAGGGEAALANHIKRNKLPVRERIDTLLDKGSPFLELSPLAGKLGKIKLRSINSYRLVWK